MRLLPIWPGDVRNCTARKKCSTDRCRHRRRHEWQHLSLRHVFSYSRCNSCSRTVHQGISMTHESIALRQPARRAFLKRAATATAVALTIGFDWAGPVRRAAAAVTPGADVAFAPNAFLRVGTDDSVTVIAKHVEMGQGAYTGIATIVAEELDADWSRVRVESAPADAKRYANLVFGTLQGTGGSSAMANSWAQLREAGAKARAMLLSAAAKNWKVSVAELTVEKGVIYHGASK